MILHKNVENAIKDATAYSAALAVEIAEIELRAIQALSTAIRLRFAQEDASIDPDKQLDVASKILPLAVLAGADGPEHAGETIKREIEKLVFPGANVT
jgi:hypothetical protein